MQNFDTCGSSPTDFPASMDMHIFPNIENQAFMPGMAISQTESPGLRGLMAMDQSGHSTLFQDRGMVQQWAATSAYGSAPTMDACAIQHVNPMDVVSEDVTCSYAFDRSGAPSAVASLDGQILRRMCSIQDLESDSLTDVSNGHNNLGLAGLHSSYESNLSDTPSLEWGPAISSNDSYAEDGRSSQFHADLPSPLDLVPSSDLFPGQDSLYSPSMNSIEVSSGGEFSPVLMPTVAPMESSCGSSTVQTISGMPPSDDFMFQFNDSQAYTNGVDLFAHDSASYDAQLPNGPEPEAFSAAELTYGSTFPYPTSNNAKAFVSRRWNGDGEGLNARSNPLYFLPAGRDGLFHCPFAGSPEDCKHKADKLKCNYDKHLDSHLKPYRCNGLDPECEGKQFSSTACLLRHQRERHAMHGHGDRPYLCQYEGCDRAQPGSGFPRHWNLNDHMKRVHNHVVEDQAKPSRCRGPSDAPASRQRVQRRSKA